eukprot:1281605-Ditylum_brightwellii.AAC.1
MVRRCCFCSPPGHAQSHRWGDDYWQGSCFLLIHQAEPKYKELNGGKACQGEQHDASNPVDK